MPYAFYVRSSADPQRPRFYIPLVRTLLPASAGSISRKRMDPSLHEGRDEVVVKVVEQVPYERVLEYLPIGNYKWYIFTLHKENDFSSCHCA
jgi:hypothetical protein